MLLAIAAFKGVSKGFIVAVFSFVGYIIGMAAALKFSSTVADHLRVKTGYDGYGLPILSFMLVFIAFVVVIRLGAAVVKKTAVILFMGWLDSLLGFILYAAMYLMVFSVILYFAGKVGLVSSETRISSKTYAYIEPWGPIVMAGIGKVIPWFSNMFNDLNRFFDHAAKIHKSG